MATQTLVANTNLSSLTIAAGDVIQLNGFTLNIDASPANAFVIASNNAASRMTVGSGSWTISCGFSFTVASSAACGTVAAGQSLTINNSSISGWVSSNSPLWTNTGGTLLISAGNSSNFFYNSVTSVGFVPITSSGGTSTLTGQISGNFNSGTLFSASAGSITMNGNITQIGASAICPLTGSGVFTHNGNLTLSGNVGAAGAASSGGASSVININGAWSSSGGAVAGNRVPLVTTTVVGSQINIVGSVKSTNGVLSAFATQGTINWKNQTVVIGSTEECALLADNTGVIDMTNLVVTNSGKFCAVRNSTAVFTVTGTTVNNQTSTAQAAVIGAAVTISNLPSTLNNLPLAAQVQAGVTYGLIGNIQTGTAGLIDYATLAAAVAALPNGMDFTQAVPASPTAGTTGQAMRSLLSYLDATVSSRLATGSYVPSPTAAQNRQEMDANSSKLANLDVAVSTRASAEDVQFSLVVPSDIAQALQTPLTMPVKNYCTLRRTIVMGTVTGASKIWFAIKQSICDSDADALVQIISGVGLVAAKGAAVPIDASLASVTIVDATTGTINVFIHASITALLPVSEDKFHTLVWGAKDLIGQDTAEPLSGPLVVYGAVNKSIA